MDLEIDASYDVAVERTPWGDIALTLSRHDLQIHLDPIEAERICREIWTALGRDFPVSDRRVA